MKKLRAFSFINEEINIMALKLSTFWSILQNLQNLIPTKFNTLKVYKKIVAVCKNNYKKRGETNFIYGNKPIFFGFANKYGVTLFIKTPNNQ